MAVMNTKKKINVYLPKNDLMSRMVPRVTSASVHLKEMRNKDGKILAILEIRNFKVECCCEKSASS